MNNHPKKKEIEPNPDTPVIRPSTPEIKPPENPKPEPPLPEIAPEHNPDFEPFKE